MKSASVYRIQLVKDRSVSYEPGPVQTAEVAAAAIGAFLSDADREHFVMAGFDIQCKLIGIHVVSIGTLDQALVHPREVYKAAILMNAATIIVAHNHPSGDPTPSAEDVAVTRRLQEAGRLLGIDLNDHIIIGDGGEYTSLRATGRM